MPQNYSKKKGARFFADQKKYLFNIDTLWLNIDSHYYQKVMDMGLRDILIEGREFLADYSEHLDFPIKLEGYDNPIKFKITGAQPPQYQYSMRNDSMAIYFSKNERSNGSPMKIQINQFVLWEKGVEKAYGEALEVLKAMGFLPHSAKLNRIDFACHSDQFDWNLSDFKTFEYPRNIKDDNKPNFMRLDPITGQFGTVYFGSRDRLALRIYDKSKEIKDKKKEYFNEIYVKHDMDIEKIWNVEFEVRRPYLKELKAENDEFKEVYNDFDKALENDGLSRLWSYLMDKYNHSSEHWTVLAKGDKDKFKQVANYDLRIEKDIDSNFDREVAQIAGRLMTGVLAEEDYSLDSAIQLFKTKWAALERDNKKEKFETLVEKKKAYIHSRMINDSILTESDKEKEKQEKRAQKKKTFEEKQLEKANKKDTPKDKSVNTQKHKP